MSEPERITQDTEHLRLLSIFHYVCAWPASLFAYIPFIHLLIGILIILSPCAFGPAKEQPPAFIGCFFVILAPAFLLVVRTYAVLLAGAGRCLQRRKHHLFCLIMAGVACLFIPIGRVLGVFSLIVLMRPSVKDLFASKAAATPA